MLMAATVVVGLAASGCSDRGSEATPPPVEPREVSATSPDEAPPHAPPVKHPPVIDAGPALITLAGTIELATYCHRTRDKSKATWLRVDDQGLRRPKRKHCYLPWADAGGTPFQPHSEAEGWVDLDLLEIGEPPCVDDAPTRSQRRAMMTPKAILVRVPADASGKTLVARARSLRIGGEVVHTGWANWRALLEQKIGAERVFEISMAKVVDDASMTVELEIHVEGTTAKETVIVTWPTSC